MGKMINKLFACSAFVRIKKELQKRSHKIFQQDRLSPSSYCEYQIFCVCLLLLNFNSRQISMEKMHGEIQGLRAIAILFVLIFHVWSKRVVYGYLGVDM